MPSRHWVPLRTEVAERMAPGVRSPHGARGVNTRCAEVAERMAPGVWSPHGARGDATG